MIDYDRKDLKNCRYDRLWIDGRIEYIQGCKSTINKLTNTISDIPRGSKQVQDTEAEKIVQLEDMLNELLDKMIEENKKLKGILQQLDKVEQPYRLILDLVYIQGKTLVDVASELGYSYVDICRKHGTALRMFENVIWNVIEC